MFRIGGGRRFFRRLTRIFGLPKTGSRRYSPQPPKRTEADSDGIAQILNAGAERRPGSGRRVMRLAA